MFEGLQKKWKVGGWRLLLILITFATGGSLTGYTGRRIMAATGIETMALYIPVYVLVITVVWPFMVLLVSLPLGQFPFFKAYLVKMGKRLRPGRKAGAPLHAAGVPPRRIVIFASGAGSNARQLIGHFRNSDLARVVLVVCNRPGAGVVAIAESEGLPVLMIGKERFGSDGYRAELAAAGADLLVLAGFLWKMPAALVAAYPGRIINIHPALLPKYGGKGMYGPSVHEAVIRAGEEQSGITIHYVDEHYDHGDVIFQAHCPVLPGDDAGKLAQRIHELEHLHFPVVVEQVLRQQALVE